MEIHHHHYHHHASSGGSLKSIGNALKHTFSKSNMEHAGMAAIPAATTALGSMAAGPLGAAAGAASGYMIDKAIQGHGFGDGLRKGTLAHVKHHFRKKAAARSSGDKKKYAYYDKKLAEAMHLHKNEPYHYLSKDKAHQKNLRAARKHTKTLSAMHKIANEADTTFGGQGFGDGFYHRSSKKYNDSEYSSKVNAHMKSMRAASPWLAHVKAVYEQHKGSGMTYSQALKEAAKTYKR